MAAFEENSHSSPIEQMNQLLFEKENIINQKKAELESYMIELKTFEGELVQKTKELQNWQKRLEKEEIKIKEKWDEIKAFEENLEKSTNEILDEKVKLEQMNKERLMSELKTDSSSGSDSRLDLNDLRMSIGIAISEQVVENEEKQLIDEIPELFRKLEKEINKSYSKWNLLELVPERYCLEIGDKEIRFFEADRKNSLPYVQIIVARKNVKTDRRLQNNLIGIERVAPEWKLDVKDNQIECTMYFSKETNVSILLKKCNDFMKTYF